MLEGLYEIVPKDLLQIFSEREVELLISGLPDVDVDDWRAHCGASSSLLPPPSSLLSPRSADPFATLPLPADLVGYSSSDPVVSYFWRCVKSFSQSERAQLLQFVTGSSRVPLEGFKALQGMQCVSAHSLLFA